MMSLNNVNSTGMMSNNPYGTPDYSRNPKLNNNGPITFGEVPNTFASNSAFSAPRFSSTGETPTYNKGNGKVSLTPDDLETVNKLIEQGFFNPTNEKSLSFKQWAEWTEKGHTGSPISSAEQAEALNSLSGKQKKIMENLYSDKIKIAQDFADNGRRDHSA